MCAHSKRKLSKIVAPLADAPFSIVDTTLREGEQFGSAAFTSDDRVEIARLLAEFGVEYLEVTSVYASRQAREDCARLAGLHLGPKVVTHIRCVLEDAKVALDTPLDGINMFFGTADVLRATRRHRSIEEVIDRVSEVLTYIRGQAPELELRFSSEGSFRTVREDLLRVYKAIDGLGIVNRLGVADTVGLATPNQVTDLIRSMRSFTDTAIEFHGHNDAGCAVANAYAALEAGATHIDTTVLGIGERNGITSLEGLIARLYTIDPAYVAGKYRLGLLPKLSKLLAQKLDMPVPFNLPISGGTAFTHKAGVHSGAVLVDPRAYEAIDPEVFGRDRTIAIAHPLTGWNAIQSRSLQLGLRLPESQLRAITSEVKEWASQRRLTIDDVDTLLRRESNAAAPRIAAS